MLDGRAGNEAGRHLFHLMPDRLSTECRAQLRRGEGLQPPLRAEEVPAHVPEIFFRQTHDLRIVLQRRQHIDESKQLSFECRIFHGQVDRRLRPPAGIKEPRRQSAGTAGQIFTDGTNTGFEQGRVQSHVVLQDSMKSALLQYTPRLDT